MKMWTVHCNFSFFIIYTNLWLRLVSKLNILWCNFDADFTEISEQPRLRRNMKSSPIDRGWAWMVCAGEFKMDTDSLYHLPTQGSASPEVADGGLRPREKRSLAVGRWFVHYTCWKSFKYELWAILLCKAKMQ